MATGSGLQQPPRMVGGIKVRAAASSQRRDGRTAWQKIPVRLDSVGAGSSSEEEEPEDRVPQPGEGCGTGQDIPALTRGFTQPESNLLQAATRPPEFTGWGKPRREGQSVPQLHPGEEETSQLALQDFTMVHRKSRKGFLNMLQTKMYFREVQGLQTVAY